MYTKNDLIKQIADLGISPDDTLLIHSSMKSIGEVEQGAETVLDAFIEYLKDGLLIFPTHTWKQIGDEQPVFNPLTEPSCVGLLSNLFLKRPGVMRSLNPTHSVAALGKDAASYTKGEEQWDTTAHMEMYHKITIKWSHPLYIWELPKKAILAMRSAFYVMLRVWGI